MRLHLREANRFLLTVTSALPQLGMASLSSRFARHELPYETMPGVALLSVRN